MSCPTSLCDTNVILENEKGFKWYKSPNKGAFKGFFFFHGKRYTDKSALSLLESILDDKRFCDLPLLQGHWCGIVYRGDGITIIPDTLNSFPLYLNIKENVVADSSAFFSNRGVSFQIPTRNKTSIREFREVNSVLEDRTIYEDWEKTRQSELRFFSAKSQGRVQYFKFGEYGSIRFQNYSEAISSLDELYSNIGNRIKNLSSSYERIYLPLSGGYDSSHIAMLCRDFGITPSCYYVGTPNRKSCSGSAEIAKYCGFNWEIFDVSTANWIDRFSSEKRKEYSRFAGGIHSASGHFDWPWTKRLSQKTPSLFLSGLGGDFIAGSSIEFSSKEFFEDSRVFTEKMLRIFLRNSVVNFHKKHYEKILNQYFAKTKTWVEKLSSYERFFWENYYSPFILQGAHSFEYWASSHFYMPLIGFDAIKIHYSCHPDIRNFRSCYKHYFQKKYPYVADLICSSDLCSGDANLSVSNRIKRVFNHPFRMLNQSEVISLILRNCSCLNSFVAHKELSEK